MHLGPIETTMMARRVLTRAVWVYPFLWVTHTHTHGYGYNFMGTGQVRAQQCRYWQHTGIPVN